MASHHDHAFDATRPALVLLFGNSNKKHRLLDREVIVIGRARGCDLGLDAPDISSIHCVITRGPAGFHLRDCQSRAGTKHNGNPVREVALRDGDLLQIGPFSFRVHLPAGCVVGPAAGGAGRAEHLQHSRRNLARIAMRHRKLLRLVRVIENDGDGKAAKEQLNKQLLGLKARIRDYDQRVRVLEDAERDLAKDRETLDREFANSRAQALQADQQLAFSEKLQAFEHEKKEFLMVREQWAKDQGEILVRLGAQKTALAQVEETLREQRRGLDDVLTALQEAQPVADGAQDGELEKLQADNDQLRQLLAMMEHEREQTEVARTAELAADPTNRSDEVAALRKLLEEKESQLQESSRKPVDEPVRDIDTYESELNAFRRQLETDRQKLMREIEQVRARNKELDEATREMELEMSRERAELARERQRLERLREDVRQELDRIQRDGGLRDRLVPVQSLRDEINHRRNPSADQTPKPTGEDVMQARIRALRNKVNEASQ
jgi:chromosome segregation ATPase